MITTQWPLEVLLCVLLALTLFRASRLEKAIMSLRRDRAALEEMMSGFAASTSQTETAIDHMRDFADGTIRQVAATVEQAKSLQDDLAFLNDRGDRLADQLDRLLRQGQAGIDNIAASSWTPTHTADLLQKEQSNTFEADGRARSKAERDLMRVLRASR